MTIEADTFDDPFNGPKRPPSGATTGGELVPWLRLILAAPTVKMMVLLVLLGFMQIPVSMVDGVIEERRTRQETVLEQFRNSWGSSQTVLSPLISVPYAIPAEPGGRTTARRGSVQIAASKLNATVALAPQTRRRGFFTATVYTADVDLSGEFNIPVLSAVSPKAELQWQDAFVLLGATDLRGMQADSDMLIAGQSRLLQPAPDTVQCTGLQSVIAPIGLSGPVQPGTRIAFSQHMTLRGTEIFRLAPTARQTQMTIAGPWATPGFPGSEPPLNYAVTGRDFSANWQIAGSNVERPTLWTSEPGANCINNVTGNMAESTQPGVELLQAVPTYRMVSRAAKYANLFLVLAFLTYFLFETVSGVRIHLMQYGLLGLSISLFALLLVSFGEPLGFAAAYAISTALVMLQASLFTLAVIRRRRPSFIFSAVLASLFGFLYVVLSLETYSLLVGTLALFAALSIVMAVTRQIRWSTA